MTSSVFYSLTQVWQLGFSLEGTTPACKSRVVWFTGGHCWRIAATLVCMHACIYVCMNVRCISSTSCLIMDSSSYARHTRTWDCLFSDLSPLCFVSQSGFWFLALPSQHLHWPFSHCQVQRKLMMTLSSLEIWQEFHPTSIQVLLSE